MFTFRLSIVPRVLTLSALFLFATGCDQGVSSNRTEIEETPRTVLEPAAPDQPGSPSLTKADANKAADSSKETTAVTTKASSPKADPKPPGSVLESKSTSNMERHSADEVTLTPVTYEEFLKRIAMNTKAKYTVVDAWATWCGPCKENFPHLVEMHKKYAGLGLVCVSLSLDDTTKPKMLADALKFLQEQKAVFSNYVLKGTMDDAFSKLNVMAIPAVFLFGPDGKEIKRFTLDDPNHQFEYKDVDKAISELLKPKD